jgi:hypothetical protein
MSSGGKGGECSRCVCLTLYNLHVRITRKSESLNLLESSGPFQASIGIVLPFTHFILCSTLHVIHNMWTVTVRSLARPTVNCTMIWKIPIDEMLTVVQNQNSKLILAVKFYIIHKLLSEFGDLMFNSSKLRTLVRFLYLCFHNTDVTLL